MIIIVIIMIVIIIIFNIYITPVSLKFKDVLQEQLKIVKSYEKALNLETKNNFKKCLTIYEHAFFPSSFLKTLLPKDPYLEQLI